MQTLAVMLSAALLLASCKGSAPTHLQPKAQAARAKGAPKTRSEAAAPATTAASEKKAAAVKHASTPKTPKKIALLKADKRRPLMRNFKLPLPLFSPRSAWNQKAVKAKVLPTSEREILQAYRHLRKHNADWASMDLSVEKWSVAIYRKGKKSRMVKFCDYLGKPTWGTNGKMPIKAAGESMLIPQAAGRVRAPGPKNKVSDGWIVLLDLNTFRAWDFWQATTQRKRPCKSRGGGLIGDAILEAGAVDYFDIRKTGTNYPKPWSSARASGAALLAGLIVPEDIESGEIRHALAFATINPRNTNKADPNKPNKRDVIYPAAFLEADYYSTSPHMLAMGSRLRLKKKVLDTEGRPLREAELAPATRMVLKAMREYGSYLVDGAWGFTFYAEDIHTARFDISDEEYNRLLGRPKGARMPKKRTKWAAMMDKVGEQLEQIPIAYGIFHKGQNAMKARFKRSNFEVVEPPPVAR